MVEGRYEKGYHEGPDEQVGLAILMEMADEGAVIVGWGAAAWGLKVHGQERSESDDGMIEVRCDKASYK
eukprot:758095-Hanusia_phi.AAC.3